MPIRHKESKLRSLQDDLRKFKLASRKFQSDNNVTIFDRYPSVKAYLDAEATTMKSPAFGKHGLLKNLHTPLPTMLPTKDKDDGGSG
ncbi:hypothetical protein F442_11154 [Phytophthora nicotianae P10297]|nr:hypothetical protein F442_11154 [Phytophthora nicotianae P10297]